LLYYNADSSLSYVNFRKDNVFAGAEAYLALDADDLLYRNSRKDTSVLVKPSRNTLLGLYKLAPGRECQRSHSARGDTRDHCAKVASVLLARLNLGQLLLFGAGHSF
jgi:hypothetical protein